MAENAQTVDTNGTNETTTPTTEAELRAALERVTKERDDAKADAETQKRMKDKYSAENAEMKRKETEKMTDEERKQKEWDELVAAKERAEQENAVMKLEREGMSNGFTAEETTKLIESKFSFKVIAEILTKKVEEATKSAMAEFTKGSTTTTPMGKGTTSTAEEKSEFQKHQESRQTTSTIVKL
jgi:hypothetical protein